MLFFYETDVHLCGPGTNYRAMIPAEQRLVLTAMEIKCGLVIR
jgi:hypothetical protein